MEKKRQPIGVFDSGAGGLSVLKELVRLMPEEDFIYYGDSLNAPYGVKPLEEVRQLTYACAEHLLERGVKEIIIACNTATSAACKIMRGMYPDLPLVGIEPAVKPAAQNHRGEKVAVMATPLTLHEEKFKQLVKRYENLATIIPVPCPDLVEYVIEQFLKSKNESQLLVTTHYDPLLNTINDLIRKDCVWFTEKDETGNTSLYSLTDFNGLNKISSFQRSYRNGVFGALPKIN